MICRKGLRTSCAETNKIETTKIRRVVVNFVMLGWRNCTPGHSPPARGLSRLRSNRLRVSQFKEPCHEIDCQTARTRRHLLFLVFDMDGTYGFRRYRRSDAQTDHDDAHLYGSRWPESCRRD